VWVDIVIGFHRDLQATGDDFCHAITCAVD
jgi:hypothetical protein